MSTHTNILAFPYQQAYALIFAQLKRDAGDRACVLSRLTRLMFYDLSLSTSWNTHHTLHHVSAPDKMKTFNLVYSTLKALSVSALSPVVTSETKAVQLTEFLFLH